jgi:hypothetical protein
MGGVLLVIGKHRGSPHCVGEGKGHCEEQIGLHDSTPFAQAKWQFPESGSVPGEALQVTPGPTVPAGALSLALRSEPKLVTHASTSPSFGTAE